MNEFHVGVISLLYGENYGVADDLVAGYITSVLRQANYFVKMLEINKHNYRVDLSNIIAENFSVIIFTIPTTSNIDEIISFSKIIKEHSIALKKIILSGWDHHSSPIDINNVLRVDNFIDIVIRGEAENTIVELLDCIKNNKDLSTCKGITYIENNRIFTNKPRMPVVNLDDLPFPARDNHIKHNYNSMRISSARGCLGRCTFCPMSVPNEIKFPVWRGRTVENIVSEIEFLVKTYKVNNFMFIDPTFEDPGALGKRRLKELAELILEKKLKLTFLVNMRAENWSQSDNELLNLLFKAGLESVTVGIESGSDLSLSLFNKKATLKDCHEFIKIMDSKHVYLAYGFIMFHPYASIQELKQNAMFLYHEKLSYMIEAYYVQLKAFPHTPIYNKIKNDGLLIETETNSLYSYKFIDEKVERLVKKIQTLREHIQNDEYLNSSYYQNYYTFSSKLRRKLNENFNQDLYLILQSVDKEIEDFNEKLCSINNYYFVKYIDGIEEEKSNEYIDNLINQHIKKFSSINKKIQMAKMKFSLKLLRIGIKIN